MIGAESGYRVRATRLVDGQGNPTPQRDWGNATRVLVERLSIQPQGTAEARGAGGVEVTAQWLLFDHASPAGFWVAGDRFEWSGDGRSLDVAGDPQRWAGPSGGTHHWEVVLREQPVTRSGAAGVSAVLADATRESATQIRPWTP